MQQAKRFITNVNCEIEVTTLDDVSNLRNSISGLKEIDVIVCDHNPPLMDAISVFNELSRMGDLRPFIIMTKKPDGDVAIKAFELKMDYYLSRENVINLYMDIAAKIVLCAEKRKIEEDHALNNRRIEALLNMAKMQDDGTISIKIVSNCKNVQDYAGKLTSITVDDIVSFGGSKVVDPDVRAALSVPCLVPNAVFDAAWMEAGMLSKSLAEKVGNNNLTFEKE